VAAPKDDDTGDALAPWPVLETVELGDYRVFRVRKDVARSPRTGLSHDFFILDGSNWVNVVALTADEQVVLVRQYRLGSASESLEIPGGCVESSDRDALHSAQRELLEETGFGGGTWTLIGDVHPNPAVQSNTCATFLAEGVERIAEPSPDAGEDIRVELHAVEAMPQLVRGGRIRHALVLAALHFWELEKTRRRSI
jgi:8-oxo-dGTP pyrophosphatase MutT (NUDIX family)